MINSLYSNKEIFLRELVSNASDACDRLRFEALRDPALLEGDPELRIEIEVDSKAGELIVRDNGIGMSIKEVTENIGTVARSGTRQFLEQACGDSDLDRKLIGQFGVGFYSAFIVAEGVTLLSRRAGDEAHAGVRWQSDGSGEYSISEVERPQHGTEIILHLKPEESEFLQNWTLRSLIGRYSDHIGFPIMLLDEIPTDRDDADQKEPGWTAVNQASALWTLQRSEIKDEDYQSFYQHISHDFEKPLAWAHNHVEGSQNYTTLLYLPANAPLDFMLQRDERKGLRLYVKRVFIMDAAEQLLPHYLRFIRGVVDSNDLPLNVSRELLQENVQVRKIRAAVVKRSLDLLSKVSKQDKEKFHTFWDAFGTVLKEGIVEDPANRDKVAALLRFATNKDIKAGQRTSLADYIDRMPPDQEAIWYITADSLAAAASSPHLEIFRKKGIEVLLMHDRVDEWVMAYFNEFEGKPLRSVAKGEIDLDSGNAPTQKTADGEGELLGRMAKVLTDSVAEVRASRRLTDSASCLVLGEAEIALHMRRMLEQAGQELPDSRPTLEVNLEHPLVQRLQATDCDDDFEDWTRLLHEQAVLAEGGQLDDPARFVQRLNRLILETHSKQA